MIKITIEGPAGSGKSGMAEVIFEALSKHKEKTGNDDEEITVLDDYNPERKEVHDIVTAGMDLPSDVLILVLES